MNSISLKSIILCFFFLFNTMYFIHTTGIQRKAYSFQRKKDFKKNIFVAKAPPPIPEIKKNKMDEVSQAYLELANAQMNVENYKEAIVNYKKVLAKYPESGEANANIAVCYFYSGSKEAAIAYWKISLNDKELPDRDIVYTNLAVAYSNKKDFDTAEFYAEKALDLNQSPSNHNELAYIYSQHGIKLNKALDLINKAIFILNDDWNEAKLFLFRDTRGWIYYKMGKYNLAERELLDTLEIFYKSSKKYNNEDLLKIFSITNISDLYYHLGMVYGAQGKKDLAKQNFIKALEWDENYIDANNALKNLQ